MTFYTINESDAQNSIADAIVVREMEIFSYDMNITNYEIMLESLPTGDWPEHLAQYRFSTLDQVPDEFDQEVSDYQYRDRLRSLLKTERLERNKASRIYEALVARLPADQIESLVLAAKARINGA